jgi:sortase (surface protein transpeptidase)
MRRALVLAAVALAGCESAPQRPQRTPPARTALAAASLQPQRPAVRRRAHRHHRHRARQRRAAPPARLEIPAIGVDAPLVPLGLDRAGALEVPRRFDVAGWWTGGARPGERGPAVIAGHVDSLTGPAVFFRLGSLRPGRHIVVERRDGSRLRFTVHRLEHYAKRRFPARRVYGPTRRPELRLITCSGTFDYATGHYLDNTVVYARL